MASPASGRSRKSGSVAASGNAAAPVRAPRVAFQGEPGAFSEEGVLSAFVAPQAVAVPTWRAVFQAVHDGTADAGVVPIERSSGGSVREIYDLLFKFDEIRIVAEVTVPVHLALLALPGQTLDQIERSSIDLYATTRSLYRQYRNSEIRNGKPDTSEGDTPDF